MPSLSGGLLERFFIHLVKSQWLGNKYILHICVLWSDSTIRQNLEYSYSYPMVEMVVVVVVVVVVVIIKIIVVVVVSAIDLLEVEGVLSCMWQLTVNWFPANLRSWSCTGWCTRRLSCICCCKCLPPPATPPSTPCRPANGRPECWCIHIARGMHS